MTDATPASAIAPLLLSAKEASRLCGVCEATWPLNVSVYQFRDGILHQVWQEKEFFQ